MMTVNVTVLIVTPLFGNDVGGASTYFNTLISEYKSACIDGFLLTRYRRNERVINKLDNFVVMRFLVPGFKLHGRLKLMRILTWLLNQIIIVSAVLLLKIRRKKLIMHVHGNIFTSFPAICYILRKFINMPVVVSLHGWSELPKSDDETQQFQNGADMIVCIARNVFEEVRQSFRKSKVKYVPLPFYKPVKQPRSEVRKTLSYYDSRLLQRHICFVGTICDDKGVFELVEAFKAFSAVNNSFHLVFIGPNRLGNEFESIINHNTNMLWLGPIPQSDTLAIVQSAEVLILPSKSEGLPRVCLEAITLGTKVICPPGITEFSNLSQVFRLDSVSPDHIKSKLLNIVTINQDPVYNLHKHSPPLHANNMIHIYKQSYYSK